MNNFHQNIRRLYREEARPGMEFGFALACCLILVCLLLLCVFCCQNRANKKKDRGLNFDEENQTKGRNAILDDADTDSEGSQGSVTRENRDLNCGPYDVLIDKNTMPFEPAGNTFLRGLLCEKVAEHENASSNAGKAEIASKLMEAIGTNGGRFLTNVESKKDKQGVDPEGVWSNASESATMDFLLKELEGSEDEIVTQLNANDVLVDGSCPSEANGNARLWGMVSSRQAEYAVASSIGEKKEDIAYGIVNDVKAKGGRFLKKAESSQIKTAGLPKDTDAWRVVGDNVAVDFVTEMLEGKNSNTMITTCDVHKCFSWSCKACQAKTGETSFIAVFPTK